VDQALLYQVLRAEIQDHKIPVSLGKTCPMQCTFCYEKDHSYRKTFKTPRTTEEDWKFILKEIQESPSRENEGWIFGGNEYMEWTETFLHPRALDWLEEFIEVTDKNVVIFSVGGIPAERINRLAERYPGRIHFELSVNTLSRFRKQLMPIGPSVNQVLKILDGPLVTTANFYSFGPSTMSEDARIISKINPKCNLWMGCLTPLKYIDSETIALMRQGKKFLPQEAQKIYNYALPNTAMIHTESDITAFLNRNKILKMFDACELDKKDTVVMAGNVYKILQLFRRNRARFLYVPNDTLGGDSDCSTLLTFNDIAKKITNQTRVYIPKVLMERTSKEEKDIAGVSFDDLKARFPRCRFKTLNKINSYQSNRKLSEKGFLKNYVEDYLHNPLSKQFEAVPLPN